MPLLFGLTLVSGLIDAVSYLGLGRVFVANMTGNVVLLGFAIGGAPGISISGSLVAIAAFMFGAAIGGKLSRTHAESGAHVLSVTTVAKIGIMLLAAVLAWLAGTAGLVAYAITALLAVSMGLQNAAVRSLAVPDMTTTVVTQTIAGIAMDLPIAGGQNTRLRRRVFSVIIMFAGALVGALLLFKLGMAVALVAAALVLAIVSVFARRLAEI
jgi:uncharacterized membrane protein YoaK (UPF0700 family)